MKSKRTLLIILIILIILSILGSACGIGSFIIYNYYKKHINDGKKTGDDNTPEVSESIETFASAEEFDNYAKKIEESYEKEYESLAPEAAMGDAEETTAEESITNIQEEGVDEGDIIKAYKDFLVVLRRGHIFTIRLTDKDADILEPISKVQAYPEGFTQGTWYDEMLIYNDKVIVVGYSYDLMATELEFFKIDETGDVTHEAGYYIDSNDYYSSRNYASRLVDNTLIFYIPYYLFTWDYSNETYTRKLSLPKIREWIKDNDLTEGENILDKTNVYKPMQETLDPTLHTIVKCDLDSPKLDCHAKAILGPYSHNFYVSPNAIYIWVSEWSYYWLYEEEESDDTKRPEVDAYVYKFDLESDTASALKADGTPIDQFSFKEDDGYLNVLVREDSAGDAMWNPEFTSGNLALLRTSLDNFTDEPKSVSPNDYTPLPEPLGYTLQNRYIGDYLLYGTGSNWYYDKTSKNTLYVQNYKKGEDTQEIDLTHSIDRIEVMGDAGVVIGSDGEDLKFSSIELSPDTNVIDTYIVSKAVQGELRSHGFFFKASSDDSGGLLGLPIRKEGESYEHLFTDSAEVIFLTVNEKREFSNLGSLEANPPERENDNCEFSCVDWYGNSRPIFYKDRIFALMGYELVEGQIIRSKLEETDRVNFLLQR